MAVIIWHGSTKEYNKWDVLLNNNIIIRGKVLNIKKSLNHGFGVILLELDSTNLKEFSGRTTSDDIIYPYKIKDGRAELYIPIPYELAKGDKVVVYSNERKGQGYDGDTPSKEKTFSIYMISDNSLNYVRENTDLK
ncbi:hypothetical protein [Chitinophaga sp. YR573]|uniref:hypothetical protein n=1 Tax=Chitinophaga sp. YR573 TaxID=1881040 RepID=UPI00115F7D38|nr:hypothetical protein [Chitinophaga sp. YR573]